MNKSIELRRFIENRLAWDTFADETTTAISKQSCSPVFILSPARSGSTLLRVMLAGSPHLFAPPELELLSFSNLKQRQVGLSTRLGYMLEGLVRAVMSLKGCEAEDARALLKEYEEQEMGTPEFYSLLQQWCGERRLVDKSVHYAMSPTILNRAETYFEDARYIHLSRHPFGTMQSIESLRMDTDLYGPIPGYSPRELAEYTWQICHGNILSFLDGVPSQRQFHLRYEDLVAAPEAAMRQLCDFIAMPFHPAMLNPYEEKQRRMTDQATGSVMVGDPKFHQHKAIDPAVALSWKNEYGEGKLDRQSRALAARLGYWDAGNPWDNLHWYGNAPKGSSSRISHVLELPAELARQLDDPAAWLENASLDTLLATALAIFLHKVTDAEQVGIGLPAAGDGAGEAPEGSPADVLPVIVQVEDTQSIASVHEQIRRNYQKWLSRGALALPNLAAGFVCPAAIRHVPQAAAGFGKGSFLSTPPQGQEGFTLHVERGEAELTNRPVSTSPTSVGANRSQLPMRLVLECDAAKFPSGFDSVAAGHFQQALASILENPRSTVQETSLLTQWEMLQMQAWNNTAADYPKDKTIAQLFEEQVERTPENTAVVFEETPLRGQGVLSYRQLNERANRLAHRLRESLDIRPDDVIALQLERSEWMIVAILGVLKAGAAYLPIATDSPKFRTEFMLQDSGAKSLLTDEQTLPKAKELAELLPVLQVEKMEHEKTDNPASSPHPSDLAYIIYTSGSTGQPKGVMVEHRGVVNMMYSQVKNCGVTSEDRVLQFFSYTFDASVWDILFALFSGATLVIADKNSLADNLAFSKLLLSQKVSVLTLPPAFLANIDLLALPDLKVLVTSGDSPNLSDVLRYKRKLRYFNGYGPTETSIGISMYEMPKDFDKTTSTIPIGKPVDNMQILILDKARQLVPIGVPGELCGAGVGLARGYLNNPALTEEKFIPHPFQPGERLYRTGDLARWLPDGNLEFLGRMDQQLKIRGYRIECGEVEQALLAHLAVQACVVAGHEFPSGKELVAYLVPKTEAILPDVAALRAFLSESLPEYMLPSHFVELEHLPLTSSGKVDRKALPAPDASHLASGTAYVAPRNAVERQLADIFQQVLGREGPSRMTIGIHDNFFHLGGHSLRAIRLVSFVQQQMAVELKLAEIFAKPTVASLAQRVAELAHLHPIVLQPIPKVEEQAHYALSNAQRRLWVLDQMGEGELTAYNIPAALRLSGELNVSALQAAFRLLAHRHESLRTRFLSLEGEGRQVVDSPAEFHLPVRECAGVGEDEIRRLAQAHADHAFDLENEHLLKVELLKTGEAEHLLLFNLHHIISDGWSMGILLEELSKLYQACCEPDSGGNFKLPPELSPLPVQYKDYAAWQNALLRDEALVGELRNYWREQLRDLPILDLPADFPRPAVKTYNGARLVKTFSPELTGRLRKFSQASDATLFMVLAAWVKALLYRYTGQSDLVVGMPVAGRQHPDLHGQIGFFVNTLVLRSQVNGEENFKQLLQQVKGTALAAFEHQLYPFDRLVEELDLARDTSRSAVFDVMLGLQNNEQASLKLGDLSIRQEGMEANTSKFDLGFDFRETPTGLALRVEYNTDLFRPERIGRMTAQLETLLESILAQPHEQLDRLEILPEAEKHLLLNTFNDTTTEFPQDKTIAQLFEEQVERTPENVAVIFEDRQLSYRQLNERANRLAHRLREDFQVQPDDIVALQLERSEWMIIAILGVLKAGAAYLPIAPDSPKSRAEFMLRDSAAKALLTDEQTLNSAKELEEMLPILQVEKTEHESVHNLDAHAHPSSLIPHPSNLAYIIYTSGSTGQPKGVMVHHRGVVNMMLSQIKICDVTREDCVLQFFSYTFDASISDILFALFSGASLVIADMRSLGDAQEFLLLLQKRRVSLLTLPPAFLATVDLAALPDLRALITSGDAANLKDVLRYRDKLRYFNGYGPTETSIGISLYEIPKDFDPASTSIPIGKPVANMQVLLLDKNQQLVPIGVPGELCAAGVGLARGYLNNPEQTDEKFIPHPFPQYSGQRLYRTGDLARWLPDGNLEFLGRLDHQLKIRGYRIEAGEVEQALLSHPAVQSTVVVADKSEGAAAELIAYFVPEFSKLGNNEIDEAQKEHVETWRAVSASTRSGEDTAIDPAFDLSGWQDSYTRSEIPPPEMQEWVDNTVRRIQALQPAAVFEIGVGTGLLLARIAPSTKRYFGIDILDNVEEHLARLQAWHPELAHAQVSRQAAHDFSGIPAGVFDTLVLNSVAQYFPDRAYLEQALTQAAGLLRAGGGIFAGDIRSLPLLSAFHASVQLFRAPGEMPFDEFRRAVQQGISEEKELVIDPLFFYFLAEKLGARASIELKNNACLNEMTRFRYDVSIRLGEAEETIHLNWQDWTQEGWNLERLKQWLNEGRQETLGLKNIPNSRLWQEMQALEWMKGGTQIATVGELKKHLPEGEHYDPNLFWELVENMPYSAQVNWSAATETGAFDVAFVPRRDMKPGLHLVFPIEMEAQKRAGQALTNNPIKYNLNRQLLEQLRALLQERLPDYMMPQHFVALDAMPLTSSGKIDRKALPMPGTQRAGSQEVYVAPGTQAEIALARIWAEVLKVERVGIHDNFFHLGGHSLRAIRLVSLVKQQMGVELKLAEIFAKPTVASLAPRVAELAHLHPIVLQPIPPVEPAADYPLSNAQRRLWVLHQMGEGKLTAYNMPAALRLSGELNVPALQAAFRLLVQRHESLRTRFLSMEGEGRQVVDLPADFHLPVRDCAGVGEDEIRRLAQAHADHAFDLENEHLLKVELLKISEAEHLLLFNMHHIVSDGWSMGILLEELSKLYQACCKPNSGGNLKLPPELSSLPELPSLPIQYKDYAVWQNALLQEEALVSELRNYWQEQLRDLPILDLPADFPRPAVKTYNGARQQKTFSPELTEGLKALSQAQGTTLFMALSAWVKALLYRYTGQSDLVIGTPVAGRQHPDLHGQIGFFVNTLVLRSQVNGEQGFEQLLQQVKGTALAAFEHQLYPFDRLVEELELPRDTSRSAVFDVMLVLQNTEQERLKLGDLGIRLEGLEANVSKFDLTFGFAETPAGLALRVDYNTDLFRPERIGRMTAHLETLLESIFAQPHEQLDRLEILPKEEKHLLLHEFNDTAAAFPQDKTIAQLFEEQVERTPENVAVVFEDRQLSYRQLNEQANRLAHCLRERFAIQPDEVIALQLERSEWMLVAILGVLKAGAAYLPIATDNPKSRTQFMLEDSGAKALLVDEQTLNSARELENLLPVWQVESMQHENSGNPALINGSQNLAYIIYTSGSTGQPKGVMIEHRGAVNMTLCQIQRFGVCPADHALLFAAYTFDASVSEIFMALFAGATLVVASEAEVYAPDKLMRLFERRSISLATLPPAYLASLEKEKLQQLRLVITAGESPVLKDVRSLCGQLRYINAYGPTECSVCVSTFEAPEDWEKPFVPIGKPIANTEVLILDFRQQLVSIGMAGELCVSGAGLARGYLNNPELTAQKFIEHPLRPGERLYRTGDLARWLPDGNLEFLGRLDHQLKIRGYRIEAGEVEQALLAHPAVLACAVLGHEFDPDAASGKELVAYLMPKTEAILPDVAELRDFLAHSLPEYMLPAHFVPLESLPLTSSGKVNRRALPAPDASALASGAAYSPPRNEQERLLAKTWQQVLRRPAIGIHNHFFHAGGDSIKAIQITSRLGAAGWQLAIKDLFAQPTIAGQARLLQPKKRSYDQAPFSGDVPLTAIQRWFFCEQLVEPHHFNQAKFLEWQGQAKPEVLQASLLALVQQHDMLRAAYSLENGTVLQSVAEKSSPVLQVETLPAENAEAFLLEMAKQAQAGFDLAAGNLIKAVLFQNRQEQNDRLLLVIHHLVVDGVSWRILLEDLATAYRQALAGKAICLPEKTASFALWARGIHGYVQEQLPEQEKIYWLQLAAQCRQAASLPVEHPEVENRVGNSRHVSFELTTEQTQALLRQAHQAYHTEINDLLLTALSRALHTTFGNASCAIALEGHGREDVLDLDISRTVGWFTSLFPFLLSYESEPGKHLRQVKEALRAVPHKGIGFGMLRYLDARDAAHLQAPCDICFNYLGEFAQESDGEKALFRFASQGAGEPLSPRARRQHELDVSGIVLQERLRLSLRFVPERLPAQQMQALAEHFHSALLELAAHCRQLSAPRLTPSDFAACPMNLEEYERFLAHHALEAAGVEDLYPLSPMQEGMLFHWMLDRSSPAYQVQLELGLGAGLDPTRLRRAWLCLTERHAVLRTAFFTEHTGQGQRPVQVVFKNYRGAFQTIDLSELNQAEQEHCLQERRQAELSQGFDLSKLPLIRLTLFHLGAGRFRLLMHSHHILKDGWSLSVLLKELLEAYENESLPEPPPLPYSAFIRWLESRQREKDEAFWRSYLDGYQSQPLIPDLKPLEVSAALAPREHAFRLGKKQSAALAHLAAECQVSLSTAVQALWAMLLGRYSQRRDVVFGMTTSGRSAALGDMEDMVGLFINTVPVRIRWEEGQAFEDLLRSLGEQALQVQEHEHYPLAQIQALGSGEGQVDLFDHILVFENYPVNEKLRQGQQSATGGLVMEYVKGFDPTHYGMSLMVLPGEELSFKLAWNEQAWAQGTHWAQRLAAHLETLIQSVLDSPQTPLDHLNILPESERQLLLHDFNPDSYRDQTDYPNPDSPDLGRGDKTIAQLFEEQVEKTPDNLAVIFEEKQLTYRQLNEQANRLAHSLRERLDIQPDDVIALQLERSEWMIAAILGVLKAGAAYLPLATDNPKARTQFMLRDSRAKALLVDEQTLHSARELEVPTAIGMLPVWQVESMQHENPGNPTLINSSQNLAYLIYTSGSTGQPKGVMIEHRNFLNFYRCYDLEPQIGTLTCQYVFDVSVLEILATLLSGGTLAIPLAEVVSDPQRYADFLHEHCVSHAYLHPFLLEPVAGWLALRGEVFLKRLLIGVEPISEHVIAWYKAQGIRIVNGYGPTETTICATLYEVDNNAPQTHKKLPIGKPLPNTTVLVLMKTDALQPIGIAGELCISGAGLARGYLNNPALTAQKFIEHPLRSGERLYRTGDLARWLPDGNIEFLGRMDHQLKIRGYRIEAGEVEQALPAHPAVQACVVVGHDFEQGKELVAYLVPKTEAVLPDVAKLRAFLAENLPDYMIPAHFVSLENLPLTSSGKVDRKALPAPDASALASGTSYAAPRNAVERQLAGIFQQVLGRENIGIHDNFFHLGGHSLKAIQLAARISQAFGCQFPIAAIFRHPRLADLADYLQTLSPQNLPAGMLLSTGTQPVLFAFPPALGLGVFFQPLANLLENQPVYAFDFLPKGDRLEKYYREIKAQQPEGHYCLMGYSAGGNLAFEFARYLESKGETVSKLILLDSGVNTGEHQVKEDELQLEAQELAHIEDSPHLTPLKQLLQDHASRQQVIQRRLAFMYYLNEKLTEGKLAADIYLLQSTERQDEAIDRRQLWGNFTTGRFIIHQGEGEHFPMLQPPHLEANAAILNHILRQIDQPKHHGSNGAENGSLPPDTEELSRLREENWNLRVQLVRLGQEREELADTR